MCPGQGLVRVRLVVGARAPSFSHSEEEVIEGENLGTIRGLPLQRLGQAHGQPGREIHPALVPDQVLPEGRQGGAGETDGSFGKGASAAFSSNKASLLDLLPVDPVPKHADLILRAGLAGTSTSHGGDNNLRKIKLLLEGDDGTTFGMEELLRNVGFDEAYGAVERMLGYPPDHEETPGRGCIDPTRTAAGLLEAGGRIREVASGGGRILLGTGHPGALLFYYLGVARWVEELGGGLVQTEPRIRGAEVPLDWAGPVAVLGNGASMKHTHDPAHMRSVLEETGGAADLVVADHGFAGAAVAEGIPAVAIMDTNDPAWAVVSARGADVTVVPMDDNRPLNSYTAALETLRAGG